MSQSVIFASLSVFLYCIGFIPYIYHVFHGRVVPHPFSWTIWLIFALGNAYILYDLSGWTWSLWSLSMRCIALTIGMICGWIYIKKIQISFFDYLALFAIGLIIIGMYFLSPKVTVIAMVILDAIILLPTVKKIWIDPRTEDSLIWFTVALSQACLLVSLPFYTFENSFFWIYSIIASLSVGIFRWIRWYIFHAPWYERITDFCFKK